VVARFTTGSSIVKPASDEEIAQILKRRLFERVDAGAASEAGTAYRSYYEQLISRGEQLTGGADQPGTYAGQIESSYPFHPELVRVLDKRLGTIPDFQRARGALKLLAEVIHGIWEREEDTEIINVADRLRLRRGVGPSHDRPAPTGLRARRARGLRRTRQPRCATR
jgi:predicted AAA+ superfamily ATPase